jgi:hypothetical protein
LVDTACTARQIGLSSISFLAADHIDRFQPGRAVEHFPSV